MGGNLSLCECECSKSDDNLVIIDERKPLAMSGVYTTQKSGARKALSSNMQLADDYASYTVDDQTFASMSSFESPMRGKE